MAMHAVLLVELEVTMQAVANRCEKSKTFATGKVYSSVANNKWAKIIYLSDLEVTTHILT